MPTSGTHITILQRVAISSPQMRALLGDPFADDTTPQGRKARFANLGAIGPDVFYAMADYGGELQDLENFLIKTAGTFECISELMGEVDRYVSGIESVITFGVTDELHKTFDLISGVVNEGLMALVIDAGVNFWPVFEPARQKDQPRTSWFWADYLHYIRSGRFVRQLLANAQGNDNLTAYALGYLTHYVTDVVGHPYVNQVVEAPWRLYWQRHHLVENFIDAYVWDRWHVPQAPPPPPSTDEQPLDLVTTVPNVTGMGAPFTFARLNDHIAIGIPSVGDPVDALVEAVCQKIENGLFDIGVAEKIDSPMPPDNDFKAWTKLMEKTLRDVYGQTTHPLNLAPSRPNGFPTADDIGAAYGVFRLVMKIATEEKIQEPVAPNIVGDISAAVQQLFDDIANDIANIPPFPVPNTSGSFSWNSVWDAIKNIADWFGQAAAAVGKAVFDFIKDTINVAGTVVSEPIKFALFLLNKFLFSIYRAFRDVLVMAAYAVPFTEELAVPMGGPFNTSSLWRSMGDPAAGLYPSEELSTERAYVFSSYAPVVPPRLLTPLVEQPAVSFAAPYAPVIGTSAKMHVIPTLPDNFIDAPLGPDNMFKENGPAPVTASSDPRAPHTFGGKRNYGGAIANSVLGIQLATTNFPNGTMLPDYNLDGDRGYGWRDWDVLPAPGGPPPSNPAAVNPNAGDPLNPTNPANGGVAHVNAVAVSA